MVSGGLILESIEAVLPLRPLTHVAFVASNYGRKLSLTISHNPRWLDAADGRELLESYIQQLKTSLAPKDVGRTEERMTLRAAVASASTSRTQSEPPDYQDATNNQNRFDLHPSTTLD